MQHPTGRTPERVALIAAGPSKSEWVDLMCAAAIEGPMVDEVWGINGVGRAIRVDLTFMMDDYRFERGLQPTKAAWYRDAGHPIISSVPIRDLPNIHAYPLDAVLSLTGARDYFNHTVPYAIAYAVALGVKEMLIFGADYVAAGAAYGNNPRLGFNHDLPARYMSCTAYWAGYATARGMDVVICPRSPLIDADVPQKHRFYGYLLKPVLRHGPAPQPEAPPLHPDGSAATANP
jgi:hypothetical protein